MNPLFNALSGGQPMNEQNMMGMLRQDPVGTLRNAGFNVPDGIGNDPMATVMHLLQSGQISSPMMQRIRPMLNMMGIR